VTPVTLRARREVLWSALVLFGYPGVRRLPPALGRVPRRRPGYPAEIAVAGYALSASAKRATPHIYELFRLSAAWRVLVLSASVNA
jgi:hypothetical protein